MKYAAVIFDLFGTLVPNFSLQEHQDVVLQMASAVSAPADGFLRLWLETFDKRATGVLLNPEANIAYVCNKLGIYVEDARIRQAAQIRLDYTARS